MFNFLVVAMWIVLLSPLSILYGHGKKWPPPKETVELPRPTGKHKVGTVVFDWTDPTREEVWTKTPFDARRLMVQIWYPADENSLGKPAPYIFDLDLIRPSFDKYWKSLPEIRPQAILNAPISKSNVKYPILIFSHGMNSGRFLYTSICQELASRGYVVASIDHTYWGPGVAFSDGTIVGFDDGMISRDKLTSEEIDRMMVAGITVMAADQAFVAEKLTGLNDNSAVFKDKFDLAKIGSIGHSMGGMAATSACLIYTAFKACLSLDGPNYFLNKTPEKSPKPFLLLLNSQWGRNAPENIRESYLGAWNNPGVAIINGTRHNSYSDRPLIEPPEKNGEFLEPLRAFQIIRSHIIYFFDKNLKLSNKKMPAFSEIEFVDLKKLDQQKTGPKKN